MELNTRTLSLAIIGIFVLIALFVFLYRSWMVKRSQKLISGEVQPLASEKLSARNKYPSLNVFQQSGLMLRAGLVISLLMVVFVMNWTQYEPPVIIPEDALDWDDEIEIEPPRTAEPPPPPPPPPPPVIEEVPEEELVDEDPPEFLDMSVDEETFIEIPPEPEAPPPPPPPPPEPEVEEIFQVVEQMPRFPGCEDMAGSNDEKKACADQKMLEFIYRNIRYPAIARENGIEGTVVISFVVDSDGVIQDPRIVRDIGGGCGQEALRVVNLMNNMPERWTPGRQRGRAVSVQFNLPVRFTLQ
ncbi:MAG: energy transducer TonB [Saprospirales bacterium]|nr:MAG: energy transducer TonB [Saprospirales bacterium]